MKKKNKKWVEGSRIKNSLSEIVGHRYRVCFAIKMARKQHKCLTSKSENIFEKKHVSHNTHLHARARARSMEGMVCIFI